MNGVGVLGIAIFIMVVIFLIGNTYRIKDMTYHCDNFGKVEIGKIWYECNPVLENKGFKNE